MVVQLIFSIFFDIFYISLLNFPPFYGDIVYDPSKNAPVGQGISYPGPAGHILPANGGDGMAEERMPHGVRLEDRRKLTMTGVAEILSFEEDAVVLKTGLGDLRVHGQGLKLKTLSP
ncbi:MAG: YabP/YqfC family sporulation protein, partial [Oscillospiraceae bacterium]|nr:YabP/YqfC family sporulation protein [Oscillospiraceae bacterium]